MEGVTVVRQAQLEDADFLAWVLYEASKSHMQESVFVYTLELPKEKVMPIFKALVSADPSAGLFTCWDGFLIAEVNGEAVAALSGYEPKAKSYVKYSEALLGELRKMGWGEEELARYAERRKGTRAVFVNSDEDCWVVEWVACRPEHRGKGYINTLLHDILNKGKEKGYKQARVSMMTGNEPARKAYEKVGFTEWNSVTSPHWQKYIPCPGVTTFKKDL